MERTNDLNERGRVKLLNWIGRGWDGEDPNLRNVI